MTFPLTAAPRSSVTHVIGGSFTLCGRRIQEKWAGEYDAGIGQGIPTCQRCYRAVAAELMADIPAGHVPVGGSWAGTYEPAIPADVAPVILSWDGDSTRHAVVKFLSSDSEHNYDTVSGERVTDAYSYGESRSLSGVSGTSITYCGVKSYGVTYGAGDGPAVDCTECRAFDLTSTAVHSSLLAEWNDSEARAVAAELKRIDDEWNENVAYHAAKGEVFVPTDPAQPRGWGEWVKAADELAAVLSPRSWEDRGQDEARARSMANHPAGKGRPSVTGSAYRAGMPAVPEANGNLYF